MANLPGYIPGDKVHEYAGIMASKRGTIGYVPVSPSTAKPEEVKKETAKPKKEK